LARFLSSDLQVKHRVVGLACPAGYAVAIDLRLGPGGVAELMAKGAAVEVALLDVDVAVRARQLA
jgi:hypothetical protein